MFDWDIQSKTRYSKCHIQMSKHIYSEMSPNTGPVIKLPSLMSTIWTNITPPYQRTAWLLQSHIYISEALSISLRRIYQQSFMEINCCNWSNSCEASQRQVWEISTITTQSADLHTVGAQNKTKSYLYTVVQCIRSCCDSSQLCPVLQVNYELNEHSFVQSSVECMCLAN